MQPVILYFPYIINLKAFLLMERLGNIAIDPRELLLKTTLNNDQIEKACSQYGAVLV